MECAQILARFTDVSEQRDGGYLMRCPAHGDSRPSLRLWFGADSKARFTCRAGCATRDVIACVGLKWPDLFDVDGADLVVPAEPPALVGPGMVRALSIWLESLPLMEDAEAYARQRFGMSSTEMRRLGLRSSSPATVGRFTGAGPSFAAYPRLVVPLVGFDGVPRGAQGRDLSGQCPGRWLSLTNPHGARWAAYGVLRAERPSGVTVVTEGPSDALTVVAAGYDAVCIRGAALTSVPDLLRDLAAGLAGQQIISAGDSDPAGERFNTALAPLGARALPLPASLGDITDWREARPVEFAAELDSAIRRARPAGKSPARGGKAKSRRQSALVAAMAGESA